MKKVIVLNPTQPENSGLLAEFFKQEIKKNNPNKLLFIPAYSTRQVTYQNTPVNLVLTHSVFQFKSNKNNDKLRFAVFENKQLGHGTYGGVYSVQALWKLTQKEYKLTIQPKYVVKMKSLENLSETNRDGIKSSYQIEQSIGSYLSHIRSKYPIGYLGENTIFLLMKKQSGISLDLYIKKIRANPLLITVTERLELTVKLLQMIKKQAHDVILGNKKDDGYIVHTDIKPSNIMISDQLDLNLIDYGLSVNSNSQNAQSAIGTPLYMDPQILYSRCLPGHKVPVDHQSDLFSIMLVIGELWGCDFRNHQETVNIKQLIQQNKNIPLTNLFQKIEDLTFKEQKIIRAIIYKMTRFHREDRMSYIEVLSEFVSLLNARIEREKKEIESLDEEKLNNYDISSLFNVCKSVHFSSFLNKNNDNQSLLSLMAQKLGVYLVLLPESLLKQMHQAGMNFSTFGALSKLVISGCISPEKFRLLYQLGVPVKPELINEWVGCTKINPVYWVEIGRALMEAVPEGKKMIKEYALKLQSRVSLRGVLLKWLFNQLDYSAELCVTMAEYHLKNMKLRLLIKENFEVLKSNQVKPHPVFDFFESRFSQLDQVSELLIVDLDKAMNVEVYELIRACEQWLLINTTVFNDEILKQFPKQRVVLITEMECIVRSIYDDIQQNTPMNISILKRYSQELDKYYDVFMKLDSSFYTLQTVIKPHLPALYQKLLAQFESAYQNVEIAMALVCKKDNGDDWLTTVFSCAMFKRDMKLWLRKNNLAYHDYYFFKQLELLLLELECADELDKIPDWLEQLTGYFNITELLNEINTLTTPLSSETATTNYQKISHQLQKQLKSFLLREDIPTLNEFKIELERFQRCFRNNQSLNHYIDMLTRQSMHGAIIQQLELLFDLNKTIIFNSVAYLAQINFATVHQHINDIEQYQLQSENKSDFYDERIDDYISLLNSLIEGKIQQVVYNDLVGILLDELEVHFSQLNFEKQMAREHRQSSPRFFKSNSNDNAYLNAGLLVNVKSCPSLIEPSNLDQAKGEFDAVFQSL